MKSKTCDNALNNAGGPQMNEMLNGNGGYRASAMSLSSVGVSGALSSLVSAEEARTGGGGGGGNEGRDRGRSSIPSFNALDTQLPFCVEDGILSDTFGQRSDTERQFGVGKCLAVEPVSFERP